MASALKSSLWGSRMTIAAPSRSPAAVSTSGTRSVVTMAKKKGIRCIVTLECTEARAEGGTPSRYTTQKNRKNTPERLEVKKYNKYLKRHTVHKEIK